LFTGDDFWKDKFPEWLVQLFDSLKAFRVVTKWTLAWKTFSNFYSGRRGPLTVLINLVSVSFPAALGLTNWFVILK